MIAPSQASLPQSSLYRAVWRWHFYAGLLVVPILLLLATTGALYLFKSELDFAVHRKMIEIAPRSAPSIPPSAVIASVEASIHARVLQITLPDRADRSVQLLVRNSAGDPRTVYADPYDGHVLGDIGYGGIMQTIRKLHSLQLFGFWASSVVEIAAGWAIILVGTGVFLWWPRGRGGGVITIREPPRSRVFWRDLHAVTGAFAGAAILFLAVTGMPWSMFWGDHVQKWATDANLNMPAPPAEVTPAWMLTTPMPGMSSKPHSSEELGPSLPWALQQAERPASGLGQADIGIDEAARRFEAAGLKRPFSIQPPESPRGAYAATIAPDQVENERTIFLDRYSGRLLGDSHYANYGPAAKVIEWGIYVHQGQQYGWANRYLMLAACLAIALLAISAVVMWWMRRPRGRLGAPPPPMSPRVAWAVLGVIGAVGVVFPLVGASILVALSIEWLISKIGPGAKEA